MKILGTGNSHALMLAAISANLGTDPEREISRLVDVLLPPKAVKRPPTQNPNPNKNRRGPWDKGFRSR